ncbi:DEAD/DEAH box helicase family protein [Loktanella sp. F6476L]|uniref:DEAD/DEAH box helicase family protein n=1 Tax=Loktanella sp. F6476L TaxID=2926405 RepID=UPI001FF21CA1|nr:DEAD/DEAH box helicase family protein [Loktanella sp. F6476L]MCK0120256.1 DEAD/DEAH box helicase family protein [Loktanella sp. F6476L]
MSMISKLRKGTFSSLYVKLFNDSEISDKEKIALLAISLECHRDGDQIMRDLAYRILIAYSIRFKTYNALFDIAASEGFAPLLSVILNDIPAEDQPHMGLFSEAVLRSTLESYQSDGITLTNDQWELKQFFEENLNTNVAISAPTSFGKSELIVNYCRSASKSKICIIVPTKALIAQTKRRLLANSRETTEQDTPWVPQIILHPDSHGASNQEAICVYTQERFFRHFVKYPNDTFDHLLIDEAHNIFGSGPREVLLNQAIILHSSRAERAGRKSVIKFFTPFLADPQNISLRHQDQEKKGMRVRRTVKSEKFVVCNLRDDGVVHLYDQFFDKLYPLGHHHNTSVDSYIIDNSGCKNIIYQNRPVKIEKMVRSMLLALPPLDDEKIEEAANAIAEYVHPEYLLAKSLKKGVLYHHGSVSDIVKLYVEHLFSSLTHTRFIICNSTLLEGVNIPASCIFLPTLSIGKGVLNSSQLKNLVGRVGRYKEIFSSERFEAALLMPEVHIINNDEYMHKSVNIKNYLHERLRVDTKLKDENKNPLVDLNQEKIHASVRDTADTFLDVIDPTTRDVPSSDVKSAKTKFGYLAFVHNLTELDILEFEHEISIEIAKTKELKSIDEFLDLICTSFISRISETHDTFEIRRLIKMGPRNFYSMLLRWRMEHLPLPLMVKTYLDYWSDMEGLIYVGRWGDIKLENSFSEQWVDLSQKTDAEKINIAIVRIKDDFDFIEANLHKYVELTYDLGLIAENLYNELKYGTNDGFAIELIKAGFNNHLAVRLLEEYSDFVTLVDDEDRQLVFDERIVAAMLEKQENPLVIFETKLMAGL